MPRTLLVEGKKTFRVTIPDDARITFGPFSPPSADQTESYARKAEGRAVGTLRIYEGGKTKATENVLAVFTGIASFRDLNSIDVEEKVAVEEVTAVWKSDQNGYRSETVGKRSAAWVDPLDDVKAIGSGEADESKEEF